MQQISNLKEDRMERFEKVLALVAENERVNQWK